MNDREMYENVCQPQFETNTEAHNKLELSQGAILAEVREIKKLLVGNGKIGLAEQVRDNTKWRMVISGIALKIIIPILIAGILALAGILATR